MAKTFPSGTYDGDWWLLPCTVKVYCPQVEETVEVRPAIKRNRDSQNWLVWFEYHDPEGWYHEWTSEEEAKIIVEWIESFGWERVEAHNKKVYDQKTPRLIGHERVGV